MKYLLSLLMTISFLWGNAQSMEEQLRQQLINDWERARIYIGEYLDAMPADKYGFRPADTVRSFAAQMLHIAQGNVGLSANGTGKERIWAGRNLEQSEGAHSPDSVKHYVIASYDFVIEGLKSMDASKFGEKIRRGNFDETRLAWILKAFEHQGHHRGQTTIYIRALNIRPPNERLF